MSNHSCREEIAKYDRLKKNYEDPTYEVVSGVFRALSKKKIIGAGSFQRYVLRTPYSIRDVAYTDRVVVLVTRASRPTSRPFKEISSCLRNTYSSSPSSPR